ncbi:hypothetical protein UA08_06382 [Talaromyces atroroseus]|uniref:Mutanase n=1 Tax=Talaromyces atroroseus TaxID=1441469 RepID=A0A225AYM7_TALAT|nr:hypothetical protein UA08_06382 [Talaromyces atroroseus]OKL58597.1 hypothetical protein UA08_06382 [Talaromyces atroroseus]
MKSSAVMAALLGACQVRAAAVFAHFMNQVSNSPNYTLSTWETDIGLAQDAHIDAFALNMGSGDSSNDIALPLAFEAAESLGFSLFFSFDYDANGAWDKADVISLISKYSSSSAYYQYNGQPFVSTFEGPGNSEDWTTIKSETGCFFMPDWSSLGAKAAMELGTADGLFSWAAWPWGDQDMTTYTDASYEQYLDGLPYMMPVSPWFFTNLPGYSKNWLWRGDNLWYDRWQEVWYVAPEFVEILTWNDYGESHYIGPLYDFAYEELFTIGEGPYNYAANMPHDGWRKFLPYLIDTYKNSIATITEEGLVVWYRLNPKTACGTGGTSGNTASELQLEFEPYDIVDDTVYFDALLASDADISVTIGGVSVAASWAAIPDGGIGIYHGKAPFDGNTGEVIVTLTRSGSTVATMTGESITTDCTDDIENWNAWVGSADGPAISATPTLTLSESVCINGTGANNFEGLCEFACELGYCPISACTCTMMGAQKTLPNATDVSGYPLSGEDASYEGLCAFDCTYGYCPTGACGTTSAPLSTPTVSDFDNPACVGGDGEGNLKGLCAFACGYGYCPLVACTCTAEGPLVTPTTTLAITGMPVVGEASATYAGICSFACSHGYCPEGACMAATATDTTTALAPTASASGTVCVSGTGPGNFAGLCSYSCHYGYCPEPCTCNQYGTQVTAPATEGLFGYPASGLNCSYYDLCSYTCNRGYCPDAACSYDTSPYSCIEVEVLSLSGTTFTQTPLWELVDCENAGVVNAAQNQTTRWNDVDTIEAWNAAVANWTADPFPANLTFSEQVSNFFNGPEGMDCGTTSDHNGCETTVECKDVDHPAGYFILNSLEEVYEINQNIYDAIGRVVGPITDNIGMFQDTFVKISSETEMDKLLLDILGLSYSLMAAPIWNEYLKGFAYFVENKDTLGVLKDSVNPIVSSGITISKDEATSGDYALNVKNDLETALGNIVEIYYESITAVNSAVFNGSDSSIDTLWGLIQEGRMMEPTNSTPTDLQIQTYIEASMYSSLIPYAWSLSSSPRYPFILDAGSDCSDIDLMAVWMSSDTEAEDTYYCHNDKLYYLLVVTGEKASCPTPPTCGLSCGDWPLEMPPGLTALNGSDGVWGNLTKADFIVGALNGYEANGNANGWDTLDPMTTTGWSDLWEYGVRAPGVVNIPVCDVDTAYANWAEGYKSTDSYYPCGPLSESMKEKVRRAVC